MKYLRRLISFVAVKMVLFTAISAIIVCAFYIAFNLGNAYILVGEGMEKRAAVALTRENATDLNGYFTGSFLNSDPVLEYAFSDASPYLPYNITGYEYDISIESLKVWPWGDEIVCIVIEHMEDIKGTVKAAYASEISGAPAPWASGRYELRLKKQSDNGQWKISSIRQDANYKDTGDA
ncbi:MAG: hypothetical protein IKJ65_01465 [Clostridia bacterium]|nr:hypothetical protein [Clostridia bacterium]